MAKISTGLMEMILRDCARAAPQPWYPSTYAQATGLAREELDASLDELRLGGLVRLTDWVQGHGQGYALTPEGRAVLDSPRLLDRLRANGVAPRPVDPVATRPTRADERPTAWDRGEQVRAALIGQSSPRVTRVLLFLNVLVFAFGCALAMRNQIPLNDFIGGTSPAAVEISHQTGSLRPEDIIVGGEWWRLLTCCFVHFGLLHLGVNMFSLYVIGPLVERMWGRWGFLVLYLISGVVGSCSMMLFSAFHDGAGASGALWGIMVSVAAWVFLNRRYLPRQLVSAWSRQLFLVFVVNVLISNLPGISAAAHFGGGAAGLAVAVPLHYARYARGLLRWVAIVAIAAIPAVALAAVQYRVEPIKEERQQSNAEQHEAETKLLPAIWHVYILEKKVFHEFVQPVIFKQRADKDANPIRPLAGEAVDALQKHIKETADMLESAGPFHDANVREALVAAKQYLSAAKQFYATFNRLVDEQDPWNGEVHQQFTREYTQLVARRQEFEKHIRVKHSPG